MRSVFNLRQGAGGAGERNACGQAGGGPLHERGEAETAGAEFFPLHAVKFFQEAERRGCQARMDAPAILGSAHATDQPQILHAIDETDRTVVGDAHLPGQLALQLSASNAVIAA